MTFVVARGGVEPPTFRFSVGRSYQLSYLAVPSWAGETIPESSGGRGIDRRGAFWNAFPAGPMLVRRSCPRVILVGTGRAPIV